MGEKMQHSDGQHRETWGSKVGFILAAAGSAIGLGNIWRFPYVLGENGGFAFLLIYVICVVLIGIPIMGAEMVLGRASKRNPVGAFKELLPKSAWWLVGAMGVLTGMIILSYYNVIAGWTLAYLLKSVTGFLNQIQSATDTETIYNTFVANGPVVLLFQAVFSVLVLLVVQRGIQQGIERWSKILMPTLLILLFLLIIRSVTLPGADAGLTYLFRPDFSKLTTQVILEAMGQAFFSLSLGMGIMITYGSYLDNRTNLFSSSATIAFLDMGIAILAGIALFPCVFAMGMAPEGGMGLTFKVLPLVFSQMPLSNVFATFFFALLTIAALTSSISLLEVMVSFASDEFKWTRKRATWIMALCAFVLGIPSALSFGPWKDITFFGHTFFGMADFLTANILLPLGGILIAVFAGWVWRRGTRDEVLTGSGQVRLYNVWIWFVRIIAPIAVAVVFVTSLF